MLSIILLNCATSGISAVYPLFYEPLMDTFHATRSEVTFHTSINLFTFGFANPVVAKLIKRYKLKTIMIVGVFGVALSSMLEAFANTLSVINVLNIIKGLCFGGCSVIIIQTLIGNWFNKNRGLMLGIAYAVCGLFTAVYSPIFGYSGT